MQAQAVELLCRCDDIADDGVELRVLKGLLTAVTSNSLHVHGQALLLVRALALNLMCPGGTAVSIALRFSSIALQLSHLLLHFHVDC